MATLKRRIAEARVKKRRKREEKEAKQIVKLQTGRNKALREATLHIQKAQAQEDLKDAKLKKTSARMRLNKTKNESGRNLTAAIKKGGSRLFRDVRGVTENKELKKFLFGTKTKRKKKKTTKGK